MSETSGWTYEFTGLDRYQEGKEIAYTVEEVNVPDGYTASVEGYNITNTHTPENQHLANQMNQVSLKGWGIT